MAKFPRLPWSSAVTPEAEAGSLNGSIFSSDPGAIGAGKVWIDPVGLNIYVRDDTNENWIAIAGGGAGTPDLAAVLAVGNDTGGVGIVNDESGTPMSAADASLTATVDDATTTTANASATAADLLGNSAQSGAVVNPLVGSRVFADAFSNTNASVSRTAFAGSGYTADATTTAVGSGPLGVASAPTIVSGGAGGNAGHQVTVDDGPASVEDIATVTAGASAATLTRTATNHGSGLASSNSSATNTGTGDAEARNVANITDATALADISLQANGPGGRNISFTAQLQGDNGSANPNVTIPSVGSVNGQFEIFGSNGYALVTSSMTGAASASAGAAAMITGGGTGDAVVSNTATVGAAGGNADVNNIAQINGGAGTATAGLTAADGGTSGFWNVQAVGGAVSIVSNLFYSSGAVPPGASFTTLLYLDTTGPDLYVWDGAAYVLVSAS